jgi:hypothetical protein
LKINLASYSKLVQSNSMKLLTYPFERIETNRVVALQVWAESMAMLRQIMREEQPALDKLHNKQDFMDRVGVQIQSARSATL